MSRYRIASRAQRDIEKIYSFIASSNAVAADHVIDELYETFALLAEQPEMGALRPEWTQLPLRF